MEKEITEFDKDKGKEDGLSIICKHCKKEYNAQYRKTHKNELAEKNKQWRESNKDYCKKYDKQKYSNNREKIKHLQKRYREKHYKEKSMYNILYHKEHPEAERKADSKHRGLGFKPLNNYFPISRMHHLHLENNKDFIIYIPTWDHDSHKHNPKNPNSMTTINSIALDYWVNESLYTELFKP